MHARLSATMSASRDSDSGDSSQDDHRPKRRKISPTRPSFAARQPSAKQTTAPSSSMGGGFAAKMMAKMGYVEGQGLGADGRGRLAPIETQLRPQGAGLGAVKEKTKQAKEEEKREAAFRGVVVEDSSEEERKRRKAANSKKLQASKPSADGRSSAARAKPKYRTVAEIEAAADGLHVPNVLKSLIDATGSEIKVLSSTAGLMTQTTYVPSETEEVKIAKRAQRDLVSFTDEWIALKQREDYYGEDGVNLSESIEQEEQENVEHAAMLRLAQDLQAVSMLEGSGSTQLDTRSNQRWDDMMAKLKSLDEILTDPEEAIRCHEIAVAAVHPLFKSDMSLWDPLQDPHGVQPYLAQLHDVLGIRPVSTDTALVTQSEANRPGSHRRSTTPYESMIYNLWLPRVRNAIIQEWDVKEPAPLLALLDAWIPVLPTFVLANVVDQLVVQRLTEAMTTWNPVRSRKSKAHALPPHIWLFPWLQYLDDQHTDPKSSAGLLAEVKRKLKSVLTSWNLSQGLIPGLDKWGSIFGSDLSNLLIRYLLPRFRPHLFNFDVNPRDQDMTALEDILQWSPFFSQQIMAEFLRTDFFPKWHQSLYTWLTTASVNYDEVGQWYQWWRSVFEDQYSQEFNTKPPMSEEWEKGLQLMLSASELGPIAAAAQLPPPGLPSQSKVREPEAGKGCASGNAPSPAPQLKNLSDAVTSYKDLVEDWCQENDLFLKPLREADLQTGLPLFRITASATGKGGVVVYLKGDILWVRRPTAAGGQNVVFVPMALDDALAKLAEGR